MKNKIKLTKKLIDEYNIDININEIPEENRCIKRLSLTQEDIQVDEGFVTGRISTIDIDADGEVVLPSAIDFGRYAKNPVVLFNHSLDAPIAYAEDIQVNTDSIWAKTVFGTTEEARKIYQLMKDRVLRTFSIGFITVSDVKRGGVGFNELKNKLMNDFPAKFNPEKLKMLDRIVTKAILVEYSITTIPSNEDAVVQEVKKMKLEQREEEAVEQKSLDKKEEIVPDDIKPEKVEKKKIEIKKISKAKIIKKVGSLEEIKQKQLNDLYTKLWGI